MSVTVASVVERLVSLARFGMNENGLDRPLFSQAEHRARSTVAAWAREAGLTLVQDRAGNLFARRAGRHEGPALLLGSHLDTVRNGGAYDGAYGVVAGICALEELARRGIETEFPIEVAAWAGEEGSRFPLGCLGSGAYAGLNALAEVEGLLDDEGATFAAVRDGSSGLLEGVPIRDEFPVPVAYLELHIEQGPVLEAAGERLGVVTAIAGARRYAVRVNGEAGHAGTIPMGMRRDALCAAAEIVLAVEEAARTTGECVATVGHLVVAPNQTNIVPGSVTFRVDARSVDDARVEAIETALRAACDLATRTRGVVCELEVLERRAAVAMDAKVRGIVHASIEGLGLHAIDLPSGAGHDAMCIARVAPAAMIFVPSAGGRSHVGDEFTRPDDLELGVTVLARAIVDVDRALKGK